MEPLPLMLPVFWRELRAHYRPTLIDAKPEMTGNYPSQNSAQTGGCSSATPFCSMDHNAPSRVMGQYISILGHLSFKTASGLLCLALRQDDQGIIQYEGTTRKAADFP